jgi:hypothetical protein
MCVTGNILLPRRPGWLGLAEAGELTSTLKKYHVLF